MKHKVTMGVMVIDNTSPANAVAWWQLLEDGRQLTLELDLAAWLDLDRGICAAKLHDLGAHFLTRRNKQHACFNLDSADLRRQAICCCNLPFKLNQDAIIASSKVSDCTTCVSGNLDTACTRTGLTNEEDRITFFKTLWEGTSLTEIGCIALDRVRIPFEIHQHVGMSLAPSLDLSFQIEKESVFRSIHLLGFLSNEKDSTTNLESVRQRF